MSDETKIRGMGALPHAGGVAFRVWAPHAQQVSVIGSFNDWDSEKHPMQAEENGSWYTDIPVAGVGDQYKFLLTTEQGEFKRIDPWQFDGWSENGRGGIYFYNNERAHIPWGDTRPDYGRGEVRQYILDNARMWLEEYHVDGLRFDGTVYIRTPNGPGSADLPDGWSLLQAINSLVAHEFPGRITIAEDLQNNAWLTKDVGAGGAGFGSQWDANFVHPIRQAVITPQDEHRSLLAIRDALYFRYNNAFDRVIYSESHDEVASGKARVPQEITPQDPEGWYAQKRSTLAAAMVFTAPGIPMLFQGQEFLEGGWKLRFNSDWQGYSEAFEGHPSANVVSEPGEYNGFPCHAALSIGPYSALIFSQ